MNIKETIWVFLSYFAFKLVDKLVEDNLPNLHYKKIYKLIEQRLFPLFLLGYINILYLYIFITKDAEAKKNLEFKITIIVIALILDKVIESKKGELQSRCNNSKAPTLT
jgi:hypothetical protein